MNSSVRRLLAALRSLMPGAGRTDGGHAGDGAGENGPATGNVEGPQLAQAVLRERELQLEAIVRNSPSALSLKRPDGRYALANPNLQRIHHTDEARIVGKTDFDLYPESYARTYQANDRRVLESLERLSIEEIVPVDGEARTYVSHMFPVLDEAGRAAYVCRISLDVTDRKRADEELRSRLEELERFNRASVGREIEMIRLKREVNALARELGRAAPYDLAFADGPAGEGGGA